MPDRRRGSHAAPRYTGPEGEGMTEALRTYAECFVCGESNPAGLHTQFTVGDTPDEMRAHLAPDARYQGYPGRVHGGILASVLDETLGRAVALHGNWCFT